MLAGELLAHREHRLHALAHVEHHGLVGRAVHDAGHDLALAGGVLLIHDIALRLAESLTVHLPGGLGGDAPELGLGHVLRDADLAADAGRRVVLLGIGDGHLEVGVLDLLGGRDHLVFTVDADLAALGVDDDHHVLRGVGVPAVGGFDRLLQGVDEDLLRHTLFGVQLQQSPDEISIHGPTSLSVGRKTNVGWRTDPRLHVTRYQFGSRLATETDAKYSSRASNLP